MEKSATLGPGRTWDGRGQQRGYKFKVLNREGDLLLLEKQNHAHPSKQKFYEVAYVQRVPLHRFPNGSVCEPHEALPTSEKWGALAWSPGCLADAVAMFERKALKRAA